MISGKPPQSLATTGTPSTIASTTTKPKLSHSDGTTASSARATTASACSRGRAPV